MARTAYQKLKVLHLMKIFMEHSDEQHPLQVKQIMDFLEEYDIVVDRKTVYDDIDTLAAFGFDIVNRRKKPSGYYLGTRVFELAELKLLVDAVQSSKVITQKKSQELIRKLEGFASIHDAKNLQKQVFVERYQKAVNESIYDGISSIHSAIVEDRQISFHYCEWTLAKKMQLKRNGARYRVSPWGLIWKDENYYLIGIDERSGVVKYYRVDKMLHIMVEEEERSGKELFSDFSVTQFAAKNFGMFGGREETLTIEFDNKFLNVVMDYFGTDSVLYKLDEERFTAVVHVNISQHFFGWLAGLGPGVKIVSPDNVQKEYVKFLRRALECYKKR